MINFKSILNLLTRPTKVLETQSQQQQNSLEDSTEVMVAKGVVELHAWSIEKEKIHENNGTVVDWINNAKQIIKEAK